MQNLTNLIKTAKNKGKTENDILNLIREYLQVLILKSIYQSKYGNCLSFMGGTCLRICHNLKRYSEDLDFTLNKNVPGYSFKELNGIIASFLKNTEFIVDTNFNEEATVQRSFIRVSDVLHIFGISNIKNQKLHIKLEIDTNPVKISSDEIESFFVTKFNEMFPILKHTDDTLFAGKIAAVMNREYAKGRDFYDLLWNLNRKQEINIGYLNRVMKQMGNEEKFENKADVISALEKRVKDVPIEKIMSDVGRFLEDPAEAVVMKDYYTIFQQACRSFLEERFLS